MPAHLENSAVATGLEKVSFHSNPKERQCQRMFILQHNCTHLTHRKVMLKILQARLQQYVNHELPDVQVGFIKGREPEIKLPHCHICWITEKTREFQKTIYFCFIDCVKAFELVDHNKLWKIFKEMGIPDHLTCFLRNLYAGQEAIVRIGRGRTDWFQIGKGVHQGCILSPSLFNLYTEYITQNADLDEAQTEIKISRRNITSFRYADNTSFTSESKKY